MKKANFQPKDARTASIYREEDIDTDDLLNEKTSKGKQTGTQALVEFLKTTSPEEFQRTAPIIERSSNLFSRIRKQKRTSPPVPTPSVSTTRSVPSSTTSLPATLVSTLTAPTSYNGSEIRKKYVEIIPQKTVSKSAGNSRSPSFETTAFVSRNNKGEPILPNKKRESSLYSGSLHHSASIKSQLSTARNNSTSTNRQLKNEDYSFKTDEIDTIEYALLQRLERMKLNQIEQPSNQVAAGLAAEHVRALGITHTLDNENHRDDSKRKVRHMQVQTESMATNHPSVGDTIVTNTPVKIYEDTDFEQRAKRAEAALENALDHFEVISGLAYKKLREIWEEKIRWESACMELRDRLMAAEQQKKYPFQPQFNQNDYFLEENEDELGLSEFPCSE